MAQDPICGMIVDESAGRSLQKDGVTYFFCSDLCLKKFKDKHGIEEPAASSCCETRTSPGFFKNKTVVAAGILALIIIFSYVFSFLTPFREAFFMYFKSIWWAILLGFVLGGVIDHYIPREYVSSKLAAPKKRTIFYSVFLGFFMSACSHGILALSIELYKKGASIPAVVAFLLASPWANMPLTVMLIGFFGIKALYIIISAIVIAVITGFILQFLDAHNLIEKNIHSVDMHASFSIVDDIKDRFSRYQFTLQNVIKDMRGIYKGTVSLGSMVLWWIIIGMGIASAAGAYIPPAVFSTWLGPTVLGLFATLALATVLEVCSEGSAPMAFELFRQTGALGNSFVFLMAGVVTDYTEIGLLWHTIGKRTAIWLPVITVPQVIVLGMAANIFL